MNNCYLMNVMKGNVSHKQLESEYDLDDFQEYNYIYYQCYVDANNRFRYFETAPNSINRYPRSVIHRISKNTPLVFHKPILYFKFIPKFW